MYWEIGIKILLAGLYSLLSSLLPALKKPTTMAGSMIDSAQ
jgi:hypothetical protein